ncbi:MAG: S9 family peptidase [Gammaproteobacteria bacterium]|nr:S9 family peptidase [Gammaproteobacteria bacterium]
MGSTASASPPETDKRPFEYRLGDVTVEDPYHWLEGSDAPERAPDPALDTEVAEWTDAQNAYTRSVLDSLQGRGELNAELAELLSLDSWGIPRIGGDWLFYTLRRGEEAQPVLYAQRGDEGEPRVLVDVNRLDESGLLALAWFRPSPDGRYVAFGTYRAGDENTTAYVFETETGRWLADEVRGRVDPVEWLADGRHFIVRRLSDAENPYSGQITLHELGRHPSRDPVLFEQYADGELATTWGPYPIVSRDGRWLVVVYYTGTDSNDVWFYDLDEWRETGELARRDLLVGEDALTDGFISGNVFYAATTYGASNKRVLAFDLTSDAPERFSEVIPERDDAVLVGIAPAAGRIVADYLADAYSRIETFGLDGRSEGAVELPGIGSVAIVTHPERATAWLQFDTFSAPPSIHRVDLEQRRTTLWRRPELAMDVPDLAVQQVRYRSSDGTEIPMFLVHRKGLRLDGENPTVLYGYGGFDIAMTPSFLTTWLPWLARGGVYAIANLRGGGEYGADWHRAGMLDRKQNVFEDFYAAAGYLIDQGYTRPERLGIRGGSNGGLLTGVAITQRPELFSAAIVGVPLLDMLRYQNFLMARYWVPEYGTAENPEHYGFLAAYSPYHNVEPGTRYPATLLTAGENDSRVHPLHARKMAAALQAATAGDPEHEPILLWVDRETGHGQGKPLELRIREAADQLVFMAWQLGLAID